MAMAKYHLFPMLFTVATLLIVGCGIYLYILSTQKHYVSRNNPPPLAKENRSIAYHIATLNSLLLGTIGESANGTSYLLIAKINSVTKDKNGNIQAHISYKLQNGQGVDADTDVLLYSKDSPLGSSIVITYQKTPVLFPTNSDEKMVEIDLIKNFQQFMGIIHKYKNINIMLTFLSEKSTGNSSKTPFAHPNKQAAFILEIKNCNLGFLGYLKTGTSMPPCRPYIMQMNIFDPQI